MRKVVVIDFYSYIMNGGYGLRIRSYLIGGDVMTMMMRTSTMITITIRKIAQT